jgi:predicted AAA+ superfamily ATPase
MSIASQSNIIRILSGYNQWWQTRSVQKQFLKPAHRTVFGEANRFLREGKKRVIYMSGPHRTGKTALIHQLIQQRMSDGVDPKHIVIL